MAVHHNQGESSLPGHVPDPYWLEIPRSEVARLHTPEERHKWIAETAYFMAHRRGFAPGHELSDWLAAEKEVSRISGLIEPLPRWDP